MKKITFLLMLVISQLTFAQDKKETFSEFILGRWKCDVEAALKEQQKNLKKELPENLKQQIRDQLTETIVIIKKDSFEVLLMGKENKLTYEVLEIGPNYQKMKVTFPLGAVENRTFIYENDHLYIREGEKNYMILVKETETSKK